MFIRIGIRKTRNTDDSLGSGAKLLLPSLSLGFSTRGEKGHNFSMLTVGPSSALNSLTRPTRTRTPAVHKLHWTRPGPKNQLAASKFKSQHTAFFSKSL